MQLEKDSYLKIQLLHYDKQTEYSDRFYFLEMSTLQATTLIDQSLTLTNAKIVAYTSGNNFVEEVFQTIGEFNNYFLGQKDFDIQNCELDLENGIKIHSHDDGEVSIQFDRNSSGEDIIKKIFLKYNLDENLIEILKDRSGYYIEIDKDNNIVAEYQSFDDYLKRESKG